MKICKVVIVTKHYANIPRGSVITIFERRSEQFTSKIDNRIVKYFVDSVIVGNEIHNLWYHDEDCIKYWNALNDCPCFNVLCE